MRGGWWAARGFRTYAERPSAGPHVGIKTKQIHEPSFSIEKTQNLRFRVFFRALGVVGVASRRLRLYCDSW
jgi:hypothetical protein